MTKLIVHTYIIDSGTFTITETEELKETEKMYKTVSRECIPEYGYKRTIDKNDIGSLLIDTQYRGELYMFDTVENKDIFHKLVVEHLESIVSKKEQECEEAKRQLNVARLAN